MNKADSHSAKNHIGLILSGGGARAAYQVGVLKAISEILPRDIPNPFDIICGTSTGAINAVVLATRADSFRFAALSMEHVWRNFTTGRIYRVDTLHMLKSVYRMLRSLTLGKADPNQSLALFDSEPLRHLLTRVLPFEKIDDAIRQGHLHAVSVTASAYGTGESISFFQAHESVQNWRRARRIGVAEKISIDHLMASSAIPLFFPATKVNGQYYCDGAVRQMAPISPALHLGASKVMVIGVKPSNPDESANRLSTYPSIAQIAGHILNSVFLDSLEGDVERLHRINKTISAIPDHIKSEHAIDLRKIDTLIIAPSKGVDEIARQHRKDLPKVLSFFLGRTGATRSNGSSVLGYLLFEKSFCRSLIKLGYQDAMNQRDLIRDFMQPATN